MLVENGICQMRTAVVERYVWAARGAVPTYEVLKLRISKANHSHRVMTAPEVESLTIGDQFLKIAILSSGQHWEVQGITMRRYARKRNGRIVFVRAAANAAPVTPHFNCY
jgi:hypothetical protein